MSEFRNDIGEKAIAQIIRLSDWLHDNEPDTFWGEDGDAATVILRVMEKYRAHIDELESNQSAAPNMGEDVCPHCGATDHNVAVDNGAKFFACRKWK